MTEEVTREKGDEESPAVKVSRKIIEFKRHYSNYFHFYATWRFPKMQYKADWAESRFYAILSAATALTISTMFNMKSMQTFPAKFIEVLESLLEAELEDSRRITGMLATDQGLINDPNHGN